MSEEFVKELEKAGVTNVDLFESSSPEKKHKLHFQIGEKIFIVESGKGGNILGGSYLTCDVINALDTSQEMNMKNMKPYMDYSTPFTIRDSGARAFNLGIPKSECPISRRTCANGIHWWNNGWDEEAARTCAGANCNAPRRGIGHSDECIKERDKCVSGKPQDMIGFEGTFDLLNKLKI